MEDNYRDFYSKLNMLNKTEGMEHCMNKVSVYYEVVKAFTTQNLTEKIENAYQSKDWKNYSIYIHGLKSSARNIGAERLANMAYDLEMAGKEEKIPFIEKHHQACMEEYVKIDILAKEAVKSVNLEKDAGKPQEKKIALAETMSYIENLREALWTMDPMKSKAILMKLYEVSLKQKESEKTLVMLHEQIDNYDFDKAEKTLEKLANLEKPESR